MLAYESLSVNNGKEIAYGERIIKCRNTCANVVIFLPRYHLNEAFKTSDAVSITGLIETLR